jgi:hypothetical protein
LFGWKTNGRSKKLREASEAYCAPRKHVEEYNYMVMIYLEVPRRTQSMQWRFDCLQCGVCSCHARLYLS